MGREEEWRGKLKKIVSEDYASNLKDFSNDTQTTTSELDTYSAEDTEVVLDGNGKRIILTEVAIVATVVAIIVMAICYGVLC